MNQHHKPPRVPLPQTTVRCPHCGGWCTLVHRNAPWDEQPRYLPPHVLPAAPGTPGAGTPVIYDSGQRSSTVTWCPLGNGRIRRR